MPAVSVQRSFVKSIGEYSGGIGFGIYRSNVNNAFFQGRSFEVGEAPRTAHFPHFSDIGTPRLRTVWNVQQVQLAFKLRCERITLKSGEVQKSMKVTFALELLSGNTVIALTYVRFKIPEAVGNKEEAQAFFFLLEELKLYALELFSATAVYGGEQLAFRVKLEEGYTAPHAAEFFTLYFEEAVLTVVFEQASRERSKQLAS